MRGCGSRTRVLQIRVVESRHDRAAAEGAPRRAVVHGRNPDLAELASEDVVTVRRAHHPFVHRAGPARLGRFPEDVLADRPIAAVALRIEPRDPAPERGTVPRLVLEEPEQAHLMAVVFRGGDQPAGDAERPKAAGATLSVHARDDVTFERAEESGA